MATAKFLPTLSVPPEDIYATPATPTTRLVLLLGHASNQEVYTSNVRAQRMAHNDSIPIHRFLPPAILTEVFAHIVPTSCRAISLLQVYRKWQYVAIKTPEFLSDLLRIPSVIRAAVRGDPNGINRFRAFLQRLAPIRITLDASCLPLHVSSSIGQPICDVKSA